MDSKRDTGKMNATVVFYVHQCIYYTSSRFVHRVDLYKFSISRKEFLTLYSSVLTF